MRKVLSAALLASLVTWNIKATATESAASAADDSRKIRVNVTIAEFDDQDRAELDREIGTSKVGGPVDDKIVQSLRERKLLRVLTSPTIRMPIASTATVSYEAGKGFDRAGNETPMTHEIEIASKVEPGNKQTIVTTIRYRETVGKSDRQRMSEIDTGVKSNDGETWVFHFSAYARPDDGSAKNSDAHAGGGRLLFVKATIVEAKASVSNASATRRPSPASSPAATTTAPREVTRKPAPRSR